jgi:DNA repair exonuclease SbcCD ATPase subunit
MLSLEEDLEKIKELENTIKTNNDDFQKIKEILNKYEIDINEYKSKLANIQEMSKLSLTLIILLYSYDNPINHLLFSILSGYLIYKSYFNI